MNPGNAGVVGRNPSEAKGKEKPIWADKEIVQLF